MGFLAWAGVSLLTSGCSRFDQPGVVKTREDPERMKRSNDLKQLGQLYQQYQDAHAQGPARAEDLAPLAAKDPARQAALQAVQSEHYVLLWGVNRSALPEGPSQTVLGYESAAPTAGGLVLMADGSVRAMTADEFQAAPKGVAAPAPPPGRAP